MSDAAEEGVAQSDALTRLPRRHACSMHAAAAAAALFSPLMIGQFPRGGFGYKTPPYAARARPWKRAKRLAPKK